MDLAGQSDEVNKLTLTRSHGALFLPNLDDDAKRCKGSSNLANCNDANDEIVNGSEDAKDLAPIKTLALKVSDKARGTITIVSTKSDAIRLFHEKSPGSFAPVTSGHVFTAAQIRKGLSLALEGREHLSDLKRWDGKVTLRYEVTDNGKKGTDKVSLKVAPLLTHTHHDRIRRLIASPLTSDVNTKTFRRELNAAATKAKLAAAPLYLDTKSDEWTQDWVEPFYASVPGPKGPVTLHLLLGSDQDRNQAHQQMYTFLGPDMGVTRLKASKEQIIPDRDESFSSFGNLETIPAHPGYPAGRQIIGGSLDKKQGPSAKTMTFLQAQGVQDPIWLDTDWLLVGHVDEFVTFLPAKNSKFGFKIAVIDPQGAVDILEKASNEGHGDVLLNSYKANTEAEEKATGDQDKFSVTIDQFLDDPKMLKAQSSTAAKIAANLKILQSKTGVPDADIVRIPGLFRETDGIDILDYAAAEPNRSPASIQKELRSLRKQHSEIARRYSRYLAAYPDHAKIQILRSLTSPKTRQDPSREFEPVFIAHVPGAINMVVASNGHIIAPKQFGPVVNGRDLFESAIDKILKGIGTTSHFVDEYVTYHLKGGEVHCASNTIRDAKATWWKPSSK